MMSAEENRVLTQVGPGTPGGRLLRHYWQPAALVDELEGNRPVRAVTLLGEELVLFRTEEGGYGLIDRHCPHRGADLCYGRLEDGGLRCPFHGWLFDEKGNCLEQPAEPEGSTFYKRVKTPAYPCVERNGIIFAYMGPGEPPPFPAFDCFAAPKSHAFAFKGLIECNWLQALEVGIDPAHASFLHRYLEDEDPSEGYGRQFKDKAGDTDIPMTKILRDYPRPDIVVDETDFGMRLTSLRHMADGRTHVRITNHIFPHAIVIPMSNEMTITQWHVPVDDVTCYWYAIFTSFGKPVDHELMRRQRLELYTLPDYRPRKNKSNGYGYDAEEQGRLTYTGMGMDINVHDQWAVESPGPIQDRTKEHLGTTDKAITRNRRRLRLAIRAAEAGDAGGLPMCADPGATAAITGPVAIDTIAPTDDWEGSWVESDAARRTACSWAV
jgi:phenylpropionate dioxygenase-like ring-hydroxylating dioxygenase large terminal subunit